jgi:hypothetical protein
MMPTQVQPKRKWTKWRIFRWAFSLVLLAFLGWLGICFAIRESAVAKEEKQLAEAIAETEQHDPRWRWEHLEEDRETIPDEQNSALVLERMMQRRMGLKLDATRFDDARLLDNVESNRFPDLQDRAHLFEILGAEHESVALARSCQGKTRSLRT